MELLQKMNLWIRYKNHVWEVLLNNRDDDREKVSYWRNSVFCNILTYLTPLSVIALIPSVYMAFVNGVPVVGFADLFAFFLVVTITIIPGIKLEMRKFIFIFIIYCLSITLLFYLPLPGPGLLFLLTISIFSALIYSTSAAYYSAWINTVICVCFTLLIYFGGNLPVSEAYRPGAWIAVSSNLILLSFACAKCLDLLLAGLTRSLTNNKIAEKKFEKANRLYQFISQINQSIVHTKEEETLFQKSCHIAQTIGKFKMAWIGKFDHVNKTILLIDQNGIPEKSIPLFSASYEKNGPQDHVLRSGSQYVCNNIENDLELENWKPFATLNGINSCIILPIKKEGLIIGSFNLYATEIDFFDDAEIALLKEATDDISFALNVFEKEKRHKLAEDTITKNEKRFAALVEKSADMQTLATFDGKLFYASPSTSKMLGYTPEDFINTPATEIIHPDDMAHVFENVHHIMQTDGSSFNSQHRLKHKNGNYIWCEGTMTNLLHEPHVNAVVSNFRDITERKQAEQELKESEKEIRNLAESMPQIVWITDTEGQNTYFNRQWADYTGLTLEESLADGWLIPFHDEDKPIAWDAWNSAVKKLTEYAVECRLRKYDGTYHWWLIRGVPKINESGEIEKWYGTCTDIEKIKEKEAEKEKMTIDLIQRNKNLEQFSYIISHNLRAPVANILGFAELMKYKDADPDLILESVKGMSVAAENMDSVIKDLNEILKIGTLVSENKEEIHFQNLVEDISLSIDNIIRAENVIIRTDFKSIAKMFSIRGYLYSVFYNLILNSIKFHKRGVAPLIEIKSRRTSSGVELIFKDNGMGIDLVKNRENLFKLYKRFHANTDGKGMGMFMVKTQVEALGGKISVISEVGKGTQFTIEFEL